MRRLAAPIVLIIAAATLSAQDGSQAVLRVLPTNGGDYLTWNIAGQGVNVLSELTWYDLQVTGWAFSFEIRPAPKLLFLGDAAAGWIVNGKNRDSDYDGDHRTSEWSRSDNDGSGGLIWSLSAAVGYELGAGTSPVTLAPLFGFSVAQQRLHMTKGYQSISIDIPPDKIPPDVGPFPGLDSRYTARWLGSWVGLEVGWDPFKELHLHLLAAYHLARYFGWADWNLRPDFEHPRSFEQKALGWGVTVAGGADYVPIGKVGLTLYGRYGWWETGPGIDRTFNSNSTIGVTQLNRVSRRSFTVAFGLVFLM